MLLGACPKLRVWHVVAKFPVSIGRASGVEWLNHLVIRVASSRVLRNSATPALPLKELLFEARRAIDAPTYWALEAIKNKCLNAPGPWCRHDAQPSPARYCGGGNVRCWVWPAQAQAQNEPCKSVVGLGAVIAAQGTATGAPASSTDQLRAFLDKQNSTNPA
jgi:hypothetical protein